MRSTEHYLEEELYKLFQKDKTLFKFLQSGSLDGVWYWDLEDPDNEWMSDRFWTLLGFDPEEKEHLAAEWQDLINQDDLQLALENFTKHLEDPEHPYDQVVRYRHKDGSTVWVRCRGIAIRDENNKPVRMLGAHNDLTAQKQIEEDLLRKTKELDEANKKLKEMINGILPICASCKKIRDDKGYWKNIETYIRSHSEADFSHSICPECAARLYPDYT
ncbi:MAG: PAS domain-containing protein [Thermodesulfobacteriota bacterium]